MNNKQKSLATALSLAMIYLLLFLAVQSAQADSTREIDIRADNTMERFYERVENGQELVDRASGVLIFPRVYKAGFMVGLQYGEGALRINGETVDYYSMNTASFGFQLGADQKAVVMLIMDEDLLGRIRKGNRWEGGADVSFTLGKGGEGASLEAMGKKKFDSIIAYVIGRRGLMYDFTLKGTKFEKWNRKKDVAQDLINKYTK